ncbi:hypothetical protein [Brevibacillus laterosporus]|uniref:Uncharacterized protein n=1 Tax=Brevibacillus laterosporus TaxID=1465 RepID=A0A0F6XZG7_BRELA|nr:hypothetical protein EX87_08965 [Brevibacillus laterosporus]
MSEQIHQTEIENEFLNIAYNRFYDLYEEIMDESFWNKDAKYRLFRVKEVFSVYFELLKYPPIKWVIGRERRPNFADVGMDLMKFVRNMVQHFPYFDSWDDIWIRKSLVNLYSARPQFIDKFLSKFEGHEELKYRFWEEKHKRLTYIKVTFPQEYSNDNKIYLKDILSEKEGIMFALILMYKILQSQVVSIK